MLPRVDGIIPRIGSSVTAHGLKAVRAFEMAGAATTVTAAAIGLSRDKATSLRRMEQAGIDVPRTALVRRAEELDEAIEWVGGLPAIIKLSRSTQGRGVLLANNLATIRGVLAALQRAGESLLVQEYIAESRGRDTRVIVVDRHCVAAMERSAAPGDFRSNLHRGGTALAVTLPTTWAELAVQAAGAVSVQVAGVDIIQSDRGPLVLEVNSSPGLEGIERVTGQDVALEIVAYLEEQVGEANRRAGRPHRRRAG
jgi:ribosomal protein S6--L-glutamate ligase